MRLASDWQSYNDESVYCVKKGIFPITQSRLIEVMVSSLCI